MHPVLFALLNLVFIAFTQSILIFMFSSAPSYIILLTNEFEPDISVGDLAYFGVEIALVISEIISDGQQWRMCSRYLFLLFFMTCRVEDLRNQDLPSTVGYQTAKHQYQKDAKLPRGYNQADLDRGFITSGLWAYSRHPNCAAEQLIWFFLYQWACHASKSFYNWAGIGCGSLALLFQGSTWLTELISSGKYPEYRHYQLTVGMFLPNSLSPYRALDDGPRIIRTSELAKRQQQKRVKRDSTKRD